MLSNINFPIFILISIFRLWTKYRPLFDVLQKYINMYVHLFPHVKISIGEKRSIIIDFKKERYFFVPNSLSNLFKSNYYIIEELKLLRDEDQIIVQDYFDFLISNHLAYSSTIANDYYKNNSFIIPYFIENAIIDFSVKSNYSLPEVIAKIDSVMCPALQIRLFSKFNFQFIADLIKITAETSFSFIEIVTESNYSVDEFLKIIRLLKNDRRFTIIFYNSTKNKLIENAKFTTTFLIDEKSCGKINSDKFYLSSKLFYLSKIHNSCLYKKISVDQNGEIKNCPSMKESFGNVKDTTFESAFGCDGFRKYWNITKDKISICKDCEFRQICTDCRAYTQSPDEILSKPLKCGYNPYTNVWEDWSTNPMSEKGIEYYKFENLT